MWKSLNKDYPYLAIWVRIIKHRVRIAVEVVVKYKNTYYYYFYYCHPYPALHNPNPNPQVWDYRLSDMFTKVTLNGVTGVAWEKQCKFFST